MKKTTALFLFIGSVISILMMSISLSRSLTLQQKTKEDKTVYKKIADGDSVSYLIIGDSIGRGSGASEKKYKWNKVLERKMKEAHNITMRGDTLVQSGATAFEGLFKLQAEKNYFSKKYDVIFILFGENDRKYMNPHDFSILYEALIRSAKDKHPNAEIVTITENPLKDRDFADAIKKISNHYRTTHINMMEAFSSHSKSAAELTVDEVHPNDEGYRLYADTIYDRLMENTSVTKKITELTVPIYEDSDFSFDVLDQFNEMEGFIKENDYYVSHQKGSFIEYSFHGSTVGVKLLRTPEGGNVDVYIDDEFYTTLSTWWPLVKERYLYISNNLTPGLHTIRFVTTGDASINNVTSKNVVRLSSIILNRKTMDQPLH